MRALLLGGSACLLRAPQQSQQSSLAALGRLARDGLQLRRLAAAGPEAEQAVLSLAALRSEAASQAAQVDGILQARATPVLLEPAGCGADCRAPVAAQIVDLPEAARTVQRLEGESADAGVWEDPGRAQALMQSLAAARERRDEGARLQGLAADVQTALELAEAEARPLPPSGGKLVLCMLPCAATACRTAEHGRSA